MADSDVAWASHARSGESWASVGGGDAFENERAIEQNDVLRFLLGKTPTIQSSKSPAEAPPTHQADKAVTDALAAVKETPELEPVSDTDSDDEVFIGYRNVEMTTVTPPIPPRPAQSTDRTQQVTVANTHAGHGSLKKRSDCGTPDMQPEDEDMNMSADQTAQLRRRRGPAAQGNRGKKLVQTATPTRQPPVGPSAMKALVTRVSTQRDLLFVALVLCVLLGYWVGIVYRAIYPISYPLPNVDALFAPYDVSNISARFLSPARDHVYTEAVMLEWEIANFPVEALRKHGPEPYEYRVFLDDQQLLFDVGIWMIQSEDELPAVMNKTISYRLRPRDIPGLGKHILRLEVTFAVPGGDDELRTLTDTTAFTFAKPDTTAPHLAITSPADGADIHGRSFVIEYEAHNIERLEVLLDRKWRMRKDFISDGNLLLRGLSPGAHSVRLEAFGGDGTLVATQEIHVELREE